MIQQHSEGQEWGKATHLIPALGFQGYKRGADDPLQQIFSHVVTKNHSLKPEKGDTW